MAQVTFDVKPATPQKRQYGELTTIDTDATASTSTNNDAARDGSPAPSTASSLTEISSSADHLTSTQPPSGSAPSAKKRKLTFQEKEAERAAKQLEKDEKDRAKAEDKQRKADEKAKKDEEKRKKAEEKEEERRAKDLEKAQKQAEADEKKAARDAVKADKEAKKAKEEEEKLRKERNQKRISFFAKPISQPAPTITLDNVSGGVSSRRSSITSVDEPRSRHPSPSPRKSANANAEYEKCFLPFFVTDHTNLAPCNRFKGDRQADFHLDKDHSPKKLANLVPKRLRVSRKPIPVKAVMQNVQEAGMEIIELDSVAMDAINQVKWKVLQFKEDVRPPYQGTYSRAVSDRAGRKLSRNPFSRQLPDTNYDYDSEAEWEPPDEDDEELGDDEQPSDDEGEDEMADFLDDQDDIARRKGPMSDLAPISSGLCWIEGYDDHGTNIDQYRMDFLHDSTTFPINPFSTKHWIEEVNPRAIVKPEATIMLPPAKREPLSSLSPNASVSPKPAVSVDGKPLPQPTQPSSKPTRLVASEFMDDFKKAVSGSDLTKAGLIEVLKKQFPSCPKDAIKSTIDTVAKREGKKEADKRWVLL